MCFRGPYSPLPGLRLRGETENHHSWEPIRDTPTIQTLGNSQCAIWTSVSTTCISRIFLYRWPQVMSISWPPLYKSMVKNEVPLMRIRSAQNTQSHNQTGYAWYSQRAVASFPRWKVICGHIMTSSGRQRFLPITFHGNDLETWGWCHSIRLARCIDWYATWPT